MCFDRDVCVVGGCGRVGLPLGLALATEGLKVTLYDINKQAVAQIQKKEMPFFETGAQELLEMLSADQFDASTDPLSISKAEVVIVIIGTPVDSHLNPSFDDFAIFMDELRSHLVDGQLLILRSTVYPGTTAKTSSILQKSGKRIELAFCPERVAEGKALEEFRSLPQIVSGVTTSAQNRAAALFSRLTDDIIMLSPEEAELAKLFTNSWRYIQFATANQFFMLAEDRDLDFYKILKAMRWKYPRASGFPGAGFAAGPCLFKDTMQLAAFSDNSFFLGHSAMLINEGLPNFLVSQLKKDGPIEDMTAGILGMAFKGESDDPRSSLSYKLKKVLDFNCKRVLCSDPYVEDKDLAPLERVLQESDIIVLGAPHKLYRDIEIDPNKTVVDVWNFWRKD